ncbi:S66 family peptidase [Bacillus sp. 1NLA3E]|uniref:S66 family peptidase n=1 Tax=Bacillus sp. 1NLA3E TaxID=666686 RepID=UPI000247F28D|nr:S66 peptidase family protein [Bacillus sp. 1NLA3E]AGK54564.1 carboxypeptidase [Bacillus sp. 1NLA3E]
MFPAKLKPGDEIRIIAPSTSMAMIKGKQIEAAVERLNKLGFTVTYGKNVDVHDEFFSSSINERLTDLHDAFRDPNVKAILTAIGGYNSNQLLKYIDYDLIRANPKIFCGYSDITALSLAIYKKSGLVTYSGPYFSTFGMKEGLDYTLQSFLDAVTNDSPYEITPSAFWSDDAWYLEQENRNFIEQKHYHVIHEGIAEGKLIGGNLCTLNLLQGTEFLPSLKNTILFIEDDRESHPHLFDRDLQSLLHMPDAQHIRALLIGRFQKDSNMTEAALEQIIHKKRELENIPVIANVNIGHVQPFATIPIGASASVKAKGNETEIMIEQVEWKG